MNKPLISVLLPVYNGQKYISDSVESILNQTFADFEIIAVDDGSTDSSYEILSRYKDTRINLYQTKNWGLAKTLNFAFSRAAGKFIARQDQDDISLPQRLEKQVVYLKENPGIAMVGSWARILSEVELTSRFLRHPTDDVNIKFALLFDNAFVHSSVMIRSDVFKKLGGYDNSLTRDPPEDFEFWSRIARGWKLANIPKTLLYYREATGSMSRDQKRTFLPTRKKICQKNMRQILGSAVTENDINAFISLYHSADKSPVNRPFSFYRKLLYLLAQNLALKQGVSPRVLDSQIKEKKRHLVRQYYRSKPLLANLLSRIY